MRSRSRPDYARTAPTRIETSFLLARTAPTRIGTHPESPRTRPDCTHAYRNAIAEVPGTRPDCTRNHWKIVQNFVSAGPPEVASVRIGMYGSAWASIQPLTDLCTIKTNNFRHFCFFGCPQETPPAREQTTEPTPPSYKHTSHTTASCRVLLQHHDRYSELLKKNESLFGNYYAGI